MLPPLVIQGVWAFVKTFWKPLLLALLVSVVVGGLWRHLHNDAQARKDLQAAIIAKALYKAELDRVLADLADADKAAKAAIAAKAEAEKAAAAKLKAREKFWKDRYAHDPQAKAWSEQPIPAGVLDGLRE